MAPKSKGPGKARLTVDQTYNPKYNSSEPEDGDNSTLAYYVIQAQNTLEVAIGALLSPKVVQKLINKGVDVTIKKTP